MTLLRDAGQAQFYWDFVTDFQTNEKAFSFAQMNSAILGSANNKSEISNLKSEISNLKSQINLVSCSSREAQAQYVHRWLQENYTAHGQKVGVVICDETMLEPVIYTLPAITLEGDTEPEPVNITKGFPLRNTAVYARVLSWLSDRQNGDADDLVTTDLIDRLIAETLNSPLDDFSQLSIRLQPIVRGFAEIRTLDSQLTWQELLILESEYQVRKIVHQMRLLVETGLGVPFTLRLLRLLMRRTMESVTMPFHGEPVTDIQVMGVLETRLLDFDRLLLLNVEEGVIPQRQTDCSFIPFYLRKAWHMQTPDERATVYAYNFFRLLSRAGETTILYISADTSEGGRGMSRFVMQLLYSSEFEITRQTLQESAVLTPMDTFDAPLKTDSLLSLLKIENGVLLRCCSTSSDSVRRRRKRCSLQPIPSVRLCIMRWSLFTAPICIVTTVSRCVSHPKRLKPFGRTRRRCRLRSWRRTRQ